MIANEVVVITQGATLVVRGGGSAPIGKEVIVAATTTDVWFGGASVGTATGIQAITTSHLKLNLRVGQDLYAIAQTLTNGALRVIATEAGSATDVGN